MVEVFSINLCLFRWVWRNGRGPHLEGRQAPQASSAFRTPTAGSLQSWVLGGIGGRRIRGQQTMRWLDGITDSMDLRLESVLCDEKPPQREAGALQQRAAPAHHN